MYKCEVVQAYLGVYIRDFLNSAALTRLAVSRGDDTPIRPLPKFLDKLILGINHEVGIQGGETVPLHVGGWEKEGETNISMLRQTGVYKGKARAVELLVLRLTDRRRGSGRSVCWRESEKRGLLLLGMPKKIFGDQPAQK